MRYSRQEAYFGKRNQRKLEKKRALIVGCGAIGSTVANILGRAGVSLRLVDSDLVELSNLHRTLYLEKDVGKSKAKVLAKLLKKANSEIVVEDVTVKLNRNNAEKIIDGCDIILDGTDSMKTRFLISDMSVKKGIPYIYAAVARDRGLIVTFDDACLRCIISEKLERFDSCQIGVLATISTVVGAIEASEAIKFLITGKRENKIISVDLEKNLFDVVLFDKKKGCDHLQRRSRHSHS